ncbi:MAG: hypothetical protein AAB447_03710 [Patescibacteria group bacterium]
MLLTTDIIVYNDFTNTFQKNSSFIPGFSLRLFFAEPEHLHPFFHSLRPILEKNVLEWHCDPFGRLKSSIASHTVEHDGVAMLDSNRGVEMDNSDVHHLEFERGIAVMG